jgi:RecA-family ATPase
MATVKFNRPEGIRLPKVTQDYLRDGAAEGERNSSLFDAACQMRDAKIEVEQSGSQLLDRALSDGLSEIEATETINSAYSRAPRTPINKSTKSSKTIKPSATALPANIEAQALPKPIALASHAAIEQLKAWFKPCEFVSIDIGRESDSSKPKLGAGRTETREEWIEILSDNEKYKDAFFNDASGVFVRVNPMRQGGSKAEDVADFRSTLIEFDKIPKDQQYAVVLKSGLPIRTLVDSGGKSLHAVIAIDASNADQYKKRVEEVNALFANYGADSTPDAGRYSRLAGFYRPAYKDAPAGQQTLLSIAPNGITSWSEWEAKNSEIIDATGRPYPKIESLTSFCERLIITPPEVIKGVLHRGCKLVLGSTSKAGKTWVIKDLAISAANGLDWMGFLSCEKSKVLYVNFELKDWATQTRWKTLLKKKNEIHSSNRPCTTENLDVWNLRGYASDVESMAKVIIAGAANTKYDLIIVDPVYKLLGGLNENDAGDMTQFMNGVEQISEATDAAIAIVAHFPKGNANAKKAIDRISGSGVFARDPDAILTMTEVEPPQPDSNSEDPEAFDVYLQALKDADNHFNIEFELRNLQGRRAQEVKWGFPFMSLSGREAKIKGAKRSGRPPEDSDPKVKELQSMLPATLDELKKRLGVSERTVMTRVKEARKLGLVDEELIDGKYCAVEPTATAENA